MTVIVCNIEKEGVEEPAGFYPELVESLRKIIHNLETELKKEPDLRCVIADLRNEAKTLRAMLDKPITFCPECGCTDIVELHPAQRTEKGHSYCTRCKQELFKGVDYSGVIAGNLDTLRAKLTDEERKNTNLRHGLEEMEREKSAAYCKGYNEGLAYVRAALAEMTERARKLGEALTYIAGSVGARDHERRIAREALEAITAREVVKE